MPSQLGNWVSRHSRQINVSQYEISLKSVCELKRYAWFATEGTEFLCREFHFDVSRCILCFAGIALHTFFVLQLSWRATMALHMA